MVYRSPLCVNVFAFKKDNIVIRNISAPLLLSAAITASGNKNIKAKNNHVYIYGNFTGKGIPVCAFRPKVRVHAAHVTFPILLCSSNASGRS